MTAEERVRAIAAFGMTERQACFLVLVMRHAGVCVKRQYARFAGIANGGEKSNGFFDMLIRRGYAVASDCVHNRGRIYHVHHKALYHAIGEPDSRYRRPVPARCVVERLMLLDAVLVSPDLKWLTTIPEKLAYLNALPVPTLAENPTAGTIDNGSGMAPGFPRGFPIGLDPSGRVLVLYVATVPWTDDFRTFLQEHTALLSVASAWTLRLVFPRPVDRAYPAYESVISEELEAPLDPDNVSELKRHFEERRLASANRSQAPVLLDHAALAFSTPRFTLLYRRWMRQGDAAFRAVSSAVPMQALKTGTGSVECCVLPHAYRHLSPLVAPLRPRATGVEKREEAGEVIAPRPQPPPSRSHATVDRSGLTQPDGRSAAARP